MNNERVEKRIVVPGRYVVSIFVERHTRERAREVEVDFDNPLDIG